MNRGTIKAVDVRRVRLSAVTIILGVQMLVAAGGCNLFQLPLGLLFRPGTVQTPRVELQVWFVGMDPNLYGTIVPNLTETFLVKQAGADGTGVAAQLNSTLLVASEVAGGSADTKTLIPRAARVGDFLPIAIPFANAPKGLTAAKDITSNQVMVNVKLIEVTLDNLKNLGVDLGQAFPVPSLNDLPPGQVVTPPIPPTLYSLEGTFLNTSQFDTLLNALKTDALSEILQSPKITVLNNQRTLITAQNEPGQTSDLAQSFAQAATAVDPNANIIKTGIVMDVVPVVSDDRKFITLSLRPSTTVVQVPVNRQVDDANGSGHNIQVPIVQLAQVQTSVNVPDGGTVLLGGQRLAASESVQNGVPILNNIPLVNRLFRNQAAIKDTQTLLILVTARIVDPQEE